jgi:hypothetical protein
MSVNAGHGGLLGRGGTTNTVTATNAEQSDQADVIDWHVSTYGHHPVGGYEWVGR